MGMASFGLIGCISLSLSLALPTLFNNNNNNCTTDCSPISSVFQKCLHVITQVGNTGAMHYCFGAIEIAVEREE